MSLFLLGLLLKILMTATIVVAASVIVERSGPFVGSLVAALPTAGGAAMIILALEHPPEFIAQSAVGSLIANAACAFFALTYAALAQRRSLQLSLGGAFLVWLGIVFLLRLVEWNAVGAVLLLLFLVDPATQPLLPPCLFHAFTGLYCPGCGATRALHQMANGNLVAALRLNALTVLGLPLGCLVAIRPKRHPLPAWCLRTLFVCIALFGFARNIPLFPFTLLAP